MNAEDIYGEREDLMTPEEIEEYHHDPSTEKVPTLTPTMRRYLFDPDSMITADAESKDKFLKRKPALGVTSTFLDETRRHNSLLPPVQQRILFSIMRSSMLRQLIPCSGACKLDDLLDILQVQLDSGVPSPIPEWYEFSTRRFGPRFLGFYSCNNRGCWKTETLEESFARCTQCKLAFYCSRECQKEDWKARHKYLCKIGKKQRETAKRAAEVMEMFSRKYS
jgi:hypothetical protein